MLYFTYWIKKIGHVFDREYVVYETALKETYQTKDKNLFWHLYQSVKTLFVLVQIKYIFLRGRQSTKTVFCELMNLLSQSEIQMHS